MTNDPSAYKSQRSPGQSCPEGLTSVPKKMIVPVEPPSHAAYGYISSGHSLIEILDCNVSCSLQPIHGYPHAIIVDICRNTVNVRNKIRPTPNCLVHLR